MQRENNQLMQQLQQQQKENGDLKRGIDEEKGKVRNLMSDVQRGREAQEQLKAAQIQLQNSEQAVNSLKQDLNTKAQQLNQIGEKLQQVNSQNALLISEKHELEIAIEKTEENAQGSEEEVKYLGQLIKDQKEKIFSLENRFKQYASIEDKLKQQDHRIAVLMAEIERTNHLLKQAQHDAEEWKQKYARLELSMLEYRQIEMTNRDQGAKALILAGEVEKLQKMLLEKQQECDKLRELLIIKEEEARSFVLQMASMKQKVESSTDILLKYLCLAVENERLANKIQQGVESSQDLLVKIKSLTIELNELKAKTEGMDLNSLARMKKQYEEKISRLEYEIQQIRENGRQPNSNGFKGSASVQVQQQKNYYSETQQHSEQLQANRFGEGQSNQAQDEKSRSVSPFQGKGGAGKVDKLRRKIQDLMCLIVMMSAELDYLRGLASNDDQNIPSQSQVNQTVTTTKTTRVNYMQNQRTSYQ